MTKEVGFVRKPASASQLGLIKLRYLKYPKVYELMADRHVVITSAWTTSTDRRKVVRHS